MAPPFRTANRWITKRVTPDYTNQLDLFSEAVPETPAPVVNAPLRSARLSQDRPPAPEQLRFGEWVPLPPEDVPKIPVAKPTLAGARAAGDALNGRTPTIYDQIDKDTRVVNQQETIAAREAQQKIKDRFSEWIWQDEERAQRLARFYNDTFNNIRLRTYDGSHLTFPGMDSSLLRRNDLDKHQKDAVWRALQNDNTLLAHCVGAGKTAVMAAAAMEMKRLGLAAKPMMVVPNHLVEQWGAAFLALYPHAHIFVAGKEAFAAANRRRAMSRIATGNYDAVIVSHSSFEKLPVSDETFGLFVGKQIEQLEEAIYEARAEKGDNRHIVKELEKAKKRLTTKLKDRADREKKDDAITFEQMGIDRIFVDESDLYKNLGFTSKMTRIAGLPNTESNRALDMYMKTRYLTDGTTAGDLTLLQSETEPQAQYLFHFSHGHTLLGHEGFLHPSVESTSPRWCPATPASIKAYSENHSGM
jgi:N12 class adenine-specific DNA methylase